MNNTIDELVKRTSVRKFTDEEISEEDKNAILNASINAPTAGNQALYTIIDVKDQRIKDELVKTCDNQDFISDAKMVLVYCADPKKWYDAYIDTNSNPRDLDIGDLMLAIVDASIAAQNAVTAAESLGIGSCYIGDIMENYEAQKKLLNIPKYVMPCCMVVFGHKDLAHIGSKPKRPELDVLVSENKYPEMDSNYRKKLFSYKSGAKAYEEYMKAFCNRKYNSDFSKEMSRSVRLYLEEFNK